MVSGEDFPRNPVMSVVRPQNPRLRSIKWQATCQDWVDMGRSSIWLRYI